MILDPFKNIRKAVIKLENQLNEFRIILNPEKVDSYLKDCNDLKVWLYEVEEYLYNGDISN